MSRNVYLALAVLGTVVPYVFFMQFFAAHGIDLPAFVAALVANPAASGFTADIVISSAVFWVWMFSHRDGPNPWPFIAANLLVGLSLALPLYLWLCWGRQGAGEPA